MKSKDRCAYGARFSTSRSWVTLVILPFCFVPPEHQVQQGEVRQTQKGPTVHLTPGNLTFETFGDVGQCPLVGPFVHLRGLILQEQCPQPVGNVVLNFQVVGCGGFEPIGTKLC